MTMEVATEGRSAPAVWEQEADRLIGMEAWPAARLACQRALACDPSATGMLRRLGMVYRGQGQGLEAELVLRRVVDRAPEDAVAWDQLGQVLELQGQGESALDCYQRAVALQPDDPVARCHAGALLVRYGQVEAGLEQIEQACVLDPDHAEGRQLRLQTLITLAQQAQDQGNRRAAADYYRMLLRPHPRLPAAAPFRPGNVRVAIALAELFAEQEMPREAVICWQRALEFQPGYAELHNNLATATIRLPEHPDQVVPCRQQAIDHYRRALALKPDLAPAHYNLAHSLLMLGQFQEGWQAYAWRFALAQPPFGRIRGRMERARQHTGQSLPWQGEPLHGQRILVLAERDGGETLQFLRYLPMVVAQGGTVVLACPQSLHRLLSAGAGMRAGITAVAPTDGPWPVAGAYVPLLCLPRLFGMIPPPVPLGQGVPGPVGRNRQLRVGILWEGVVDGESVYGEPASMGSVEHLHPLMGVPGVDFHNLQRGRSGALLYRIVDRKRVPWSADGVEDLADLVTPLLELDLLVAVESLEVHLAAALGLEVWVLLPFGSDWRWPAEGCDTPWYPSVRMFRQQEPGNWTGVLIQLAAALRARTLTRTGGTVS